MFLNRRNKNFGLNFEWMQWCIAVRENGDEVEEKNNGIKTEKGREVGAREDRGKTRKGERER